jgi:uncharacterized protein YbjT (DUF2867 family)
MKKDPVLVIGGTGYLGAKVVSELLRRGKPVRALVRPGSDPSRLAAQGVEIVRGDMLDYASLHTAMQQASALVTTAIGYAARRKGDSSRTDDEGNHNLIRAAQATGLPRFVFTSVLNAERAENVSHFYQKFLIERALAASGLPFVAIRPPGFIDQVLTSEAIRKGRLRSPFDPDARASIIWADDVARYLVLAVDEPRALGKAIAVAADRPLSFNEIAAGLSKLMGKPFQVQSTPRMLLKLMMPLIGLFSPMMREMPAMIDFIASGSYIADTTLQRELFDVRSSEDTLQQWLRANT